MYVAFVLFEAFCIIKARGSMGFEREAAYTLWLQVWTYPAFSFSQERHLEVGVRDVGLRFVVPPPTPLPATDLLIVLGPMKWYKGAQGECIK